MDTVITVENVWKKFSKSLQDSMIYGVRDIARDLIGVKNHQDLRASEFWAIQNVSFSVNAGECIGIIGANGSGKSTLLKMISGIFLPDKGRIRVRGKVGTLIEVGAGFHPLLTGRENIYVNGVILGMSKSEIDNKIDQIISFAELENFIDSPVGHYSSGMLVRLGFSIVMHADQNILIVDEALAVGDIRFQAKCMTAFHEIRNKGITVLIVSHDSNTINSLCDRAVYLGNGSMIDIGESGHLTDEYIRSSRVQENNQDTISEETILDTTNPGEAVHSGTRVTLDRVPQNTDKAFFTNIEMLDLNGVPARKVEYSQEVHFRIEIEFSCDIDVNVSYCIRDDKHIKLTGSSTMLEGYEPIPGKAGQKIVVGFITNLTLMRGTYNLLVSVSTPIVDGYSETIINQIDNAIIFELSQRQKQKLNSKVYLPNRVSVTKN